VHTKSFRNNRHQVPSKEWTVKYKITVFGNKKTKGLKWYRQDRLKLHNLFKETVSLMIA